MSGFLSAIREELPNKEFRESYVEENSRRGLAYQITALREARGWSRAEFSRQANRPQGNVLRWEDPTYGKYSLSTLIEIAAIFDVALSVKFVSFGDLLTSVSNLKPEKLAVLSYEAELQASEHSRIGPSALEAFAESPKQQATTDMGKILAQPNPKAGSHLPPAPPTNGANASVSRALEAI
jgi:transcriptional regulator with XRE-family HTH domain